MVKVLLHYFYSLIIVVTVATIAYFFKDFIGYESVGFIFLLVVLIISLSSNFGPIVFTALLSVIIWDLFFIPPFGTFYISKSTDVMLCITYLITAIITGILNNKAREADKFEAYSKLQQALLSSISHELKTPLTTIIGTATTILNLKDYNQKKLMQELMEALLESADKLKYTVENLLDMTRIQSNKLQLKKEWCDIRDIINSIIDKNHRLLHNFHLYVVCKKDTSPVFVDYKLLEQALANIVINAATYSNKETRITIDAKMDDDLIVSINDQGPGIQKDERSKIFDKFYRIPGSPNGGTGLGLYISKQILELHGATITVQEGDSGQGSKFIITLPINYGEKT